MNLVVVFKSFQQKVGSLVLGLYLLPVDVTEYVQQTIKLS